MASADEFALVKIVRKIELFSHLDVDEAKKVLSLGVKKSHAEGEFVSRKGERSTSFGILLAGQIGVYEDDDKRLGFLQVGDSMNAIGAFLRSPILVTSRAEAPCTLLYFSTLDIRSLRSSDLLLYTKIIERVLELAERLIAGMVPKVKQIEE